MSDVNDQIDDASAPAIVCFGDALIDLLERHDDQGNAILRPFAGGAPANVAAGIARLGGESAFAGGVGDDHFGHFLVNTLLDEGVNMDMTLFSSDGPTGLALVTLDPATGDRSFAFYRHNAAYSHYLPEHFDAEYLATSQFFHFVSNIISTPALQSTSLEAIRMIHESGGLVSFDVNYRYGFWDDAKGAKDVVQAFIKHSDIIKLSDDELHWLVPDPAEHETYLQSLLTHPNKLVLLTLGDKGVRYFTQYHSGTIHGFPTTAVDATAAGDSFVAGVLYQMSLVELDQTNFATWLQDVSSLEQSLRYGCASASVTVSRYGAIPSLPTSAEVQEVLDAK